MRSFKSITEIKVALKNQISAIKLSIAINTAPWAYTEKHCNSERGRNWSIFSCNSIANFRDTRTGPSEASPGFGGSRNWWFRLFLECPRVGYQMRRDILVSLSRSKIRYDQPLIAASWWFFFFPLGPWPAQNQREASPKQRGLGIPVHLIVSSDLRSRRASLSSCPAVLTEKTKKALALWIHKGLWKRSLPSRRICDYSNDAPLWSNIICGKKLQILDLLNVLE